MAESGVASEVRPLQVTEMVATAERWASELRATATGPYRSEFRAAAAKADKLAAALKALLDA